MIITINSIIKFLLLILFSSILFYYFKFYTGLKNYKRKFKVITNIFIEVLKSDINNNDTRIILYINESNDDKNIDKIDVLTPIEYNNLNINNYKFLELLSSNKSSIIYNTLAIDFRYINNIIYAENNYDRSRMITDIIYMCKYLIDNPYLKSSINIPKDEIMRFKKDLFVSKLKGEEIYCKNKNQ